MKAAQKVFYIALLWLSIALVGYGVALRQAAHKERTERTARPVDPNADPSAKITRDGIIKTSDVTGTIVKDVKFTIEGSEQPLIIPVSSLAASGHGTDVMRYLHPGAKVHVVARASDMHVLQFFSNFGTVYQKNLLSEEEVSRGEDVELASIESRGMLFAILGGLLFPLVLGGQIVKRVRQKGGAVQARHS